MSNDKTISELIDNIRQGDDDERITFVGDDGKTVAKFEPSTLRILCELAKITAIKLIEENENCEGPGVEDALTVGWAALEDAREIIDFMNGE